MPTLKRKGTHSSRSKEPDRVLEINDREHSGHQHFADNFIRTSKYTLLTFLPKNLFEQFQRVANVYFLLQIVIMSIPEITALNPESTAVPLLFVLAATAVKDAYDDIKRHHSDKGVNNRKCKVLLDNSRVVERWMKLKVGDILRLDNNEQIPADVLVLTTSEENGLCYIETAELDGETNLKCRQPLPETAEMGDDEEILANFKAEVTCEPPNNRLDRFNGKMSWDHQEYSLDNDNIILRGCVLRNTQWVYSVVVYAGKDSKLMMNSGVSKFKRTNLDKLLNRLIIGIAMLLVLICILLSIGTTLWEHFVGKYFQVFLSWPSFYLNNTVVIGIVHWPSFIMVLNTLIPISLYISVEVIRVGQSVWINWDALMYYEKKNTEACARTTTLTEELGQIEYVFSDKTGTLTQNVMTFKKCSIQGTLYGKGEDTESDQTCGGTFISDLTIPEEEESPSPRVDFSRNPYYDGKFKYYDQSLLDDIYNNNKDCHEMMRLLALCHTVMVDNINGELEYQAQSPDEAALVTAARNFGFVFKERSPTTLTIDALGEEEKYELLAILDFNNERKRMSVIIRRNNEIKLYCKGADSHLYERMDPSCKEMMKTTTDHLNRFASDGLRTLVTAFKDLSQQEYKAWKSKYDEASVAMENRDEKVQEVYEEIEENLILIGATAIEDKLQDGVPDAIATLAAANIKIWVLTGDKLGSNIIGSNISVVFLLNYQALVVQLVKDNKNAVTLAIGDGANDVSMIKAAHIGVGISGQEGMQAVLASDYSFAQFRYLERLLLVHGRWSYMRMCKFLNYFFYKNFAFTLIQLWYAFYTGYSAQTLYDAWFISFYNVLFTSGPVVFLAIFDQDVSHTSCIKYPKLYIPGQKNILFNKKVFAFSLLYGALTSIWLFFAASRVFGNAIDADGKDTSSLKFFGTVVAATLVVVVNLEISLMTQYWTWVNHFFTWGSILFYFAFYFIYYSEFVFDNVTKQLHYYGVQFQVFGNPLFWLYLPIVAVVTNIPSFADKFIRAEIKPKLSDVIRMKEQGRERTVINIKEFHPRINRRRSSKRTSYAFSHQEGFGKIVMSPASFLRRKLNVRKDRK